MKNKYITTQILLACQSKPAHGKKDIHSQLAETIAERKQLVQQIELIQWKAKIIAHLNFPQAA